MQSDLDHCDLAGNVVMALIVIHVFTKQTAISLTPPGLEGLLCRVACGGCAGFDDKILAASLRQKRTFLEF